ncbi:MAG: hypothetical protein WCE90_04805 [Candidatus Zixiibacteriota bacterium]
MKRWMKTTALTVAVLNLLMLVASLCPVSTLGLAYAGNDRPTVKAQPVGNDDPNMMPLSCSRCRHCHGLGCIIKCGKCGFDTLVDILESLD